MFMKPNFNTPLIIKPLLIAMAIAILSAACSKDDDTETTGTPTVYEATYTRFDLVDNPDYQFRFEQKIAPQLGEASGIVAGRKNAGVVYLHEDSGNRNVIFVYDTLGVLLGEWVLPGITNRDWEDIAIGPGPIDGETYIYVGDIGDNRASREFTTIYRFIEPILPTNTTGAPFKIDIANIDAIRLAYPDGPRDAETLMIDPITKDLIIISKREVQVHVYQLPYPQATNGSLTPVYFKGKLPLRTITAGDISPDGTEIIIKDLGAIYHWKVAHESLIKTLFVQQPTKPAYLPEVQGEALGWDANGKGYYTITEIENHQVDAVLRFFSK